MEPEHGDSTPTTEPHGDGQLLVPAEFFFELEKIYSSDANLKDAWELEAPALQEIIPQIAEEIKFNYHLRLPLGVGGSGIVAAVEDKNLNRKRALKISRPSPGKEKVLTRILRSETESLLRLSHPNLIQIFAQGAVTHKTHDYPYYVMEFVKDALDSNKYIKQKGITGDDVLNIFRGVLWAVEYLHDQGTIHMDLKPGNILVTAVGVPIISDLGFAKQLRVGKDHTLIGGTEGFLHPDARKLVEEVKSDPNRLRGEALRNALKETWDLFSLGKTFLNLLNLLDEQNSKALSSYQRKFLKLLACRLLDGQNSENERALGLSISTFKEIKYITVKAARIDVEKLIGIYNLEARVPELNLHTQDTIQASTLATTPFTPRVKELLSHQALMRLGTVSQLGLLNLIYPTATHTRLEHVIGTFSVLCRYLVALYNDPFNPLFRQIMDESDLRASLLSALLHDIGHYPLAHDFEEAEPNLFSHEEIGENYLLSPNNSLAALIARRDGWNLPIERVVSILNAEPQTIKGTLKDRILHTLISGPIDADKLDYLIRDSLRLGLNYGKINDLERLLRTLTVVFRRYDGNTYASLGIHEKGKVPAEAVAFSRYAMFGQVYWHHAYRAIKAMLQRMIWEALDRAKDDKARKLFRDSFRRLVAPDDFNEAEQPNLFKRPEPQVSQILPGDYAMLYWLSEKSGVVGMQFFDLFRHRRLYKRVLILSSEKMPDKGLWESLSEFYRSNRKNWRKKLKLQQEFQKHVGELVENPPEPPPLSIVITNDAKNKFIVDCHDKVVLLVDIPTARPGSSTPLEFVIEEDRRRVKSDEMRTGSLEHSVIWKALQDSFQESIGKLRVFCHPDHSDFLSAYLSRQSIENALTSALQLTEQE
jgi:HD superfamily phosphohydrolase